MAAKNISKRRPAALIVYDRKFRSSSLREEQSAGMGGAPDTRGTKVRAVLLQAMSSVSVRTGNDFLATMSCGLLVSRATGAKSFARS